MIRMTPAIRLSIGLVILMISILILAQAFGLMATSEKQQLNARQLFSENLAAQLIQPIMKGDDLLLHYYLDSAVKLNAEVLSIGIRLRDEKVVAQTNDHANYWKDADPKNSTATHIRMPLLLNGQYKANVEISFKPLAVDRHPIFKIPLFVVLIVFVALSGFIGFWFYIKRALHHLDPSSVVPARVRNALNALTEGILILDKREHIVLANTSIIEKLGINESVLFGKKASTLAWQIDDKQEARSLPWLSAIAQNTKIEGVRLLLKATDKKMVVFRVNAVPIMDAGGGTQGVIAVFNDITEVEEKSRFLEDILGQLAASQSEIESRNRKLFHMATRDPLTDCFNRRALYEHLEGKFDGNRSSDVEYSCIMADIDHFKRVNDTYGHNVGDEVIKMAANTLKEMVRDVDMVARFGGEEFCIVLPGAPLEQAAAIAERCRMKIAEQVCGDGVKVTSSFGVTSIRLGAKDGEALVHQADEALYFSKRNGRNRVSSWRPHILDSVPPEN